MKERLIPWVSTALPEIWSLPWMYRRRQKHGFPCNPMKKQKQNFRWSLSWRLVMNWKEKNWRSSGRWKIRIRKHCTFPSEDTPHLCALWMKKESSRNIISSLIRTKIWLTDWWQMTDKDSWDSKRMYYRWKTVMRRSQSTYLTGMPWLWRIVRLLQWACVLRTKSRMLP